MTPEQFKTLRAQSGLSQGGLADKLGVTRATVNRWETGALPVAAYVTPELMLDVTAEANVTPETVTLPERKGRNVTPVPDLSKLTPWVVSDGLTKRDFKAFQLDETKWQVCGHRVVSALIPDPIAYNPPDWAGWRAILTQSGQVYDYETGARLTPFGVTPRPQPPPPGSRQQLDKKYRRAA